MRHCTTFRIFQCIPRISIAVRLQLKNSQDYTGLATVDNVMQ